MIMRILVASLAVLAAACGSSSSPTSPTSTTGTSTSTTSIATPTVTEEWDSTLPVNGAKFYSFTVDQNGTVNVTLASIGGSFVPPTVTVSLGLGDPSGTDCSTTSTTNVSTLTAAPQVTGTLAPGVHCVRIADVGNLFAPGTFSVLVAHP